MTNAKKRLTPPVLELLQYYLHKTKHSDLSMRNKLFLFLVVFVVLLILGIFLLFVITGTIVPGVNVIHQDFKKDLNTAAYDIATQYGTLSAHAVEFANELSTSIEQELALRGLLTSDLQKNPHLLAEIIGQQYQKSLFALKSSKSSGVFLILDATCNSTMARAASSRAGLYIKNMEPNIISSSSDYLMLLRGSSSIARENVTMLHPQWRMELDVAKANFFTRPMAEAKENSVELSRLYYWNPAMGLPESNEEMMLCSVPLVDSTGYVFGVCGFEISAMLFKLSHMPDNKTYPRIFCVLIPLTEDILDMSQAFFAGGYSVGADSKTGQSLVVQDNSTLNSYYNQKDGTRYRGLHQQVSLYPQGSAFTNERWAVALLAPEDEISALITRSNIEIILTFTFLLLSGIFISYRLSKLYFIPINKGIDLIKNNDYSNATKTHIVEIDDLIAYLSSRQETKADTEQDENNEAKLPLVVFDEFVKNTALLSPAEKAVFKLYVAGNTATEITQILGLSINTIKTHNKRIYMKLNVASRRELLVYVKMLKEMGKEIL